MDDRIKAYVLVSGGRMRNWGAWDRKVEGNPAAKLSKADFAGWMSRAAVLDATYVVPNKSSRFLLLVGKEDTPAVRDAKALHAAHPARTSLYVYDGGHDPFPEAREYLKAWLEKTL